MPLFQQFFRSSTASSPPQPNSVPNPSIVTATSPTSAGASANPVTPHATANLNTIAATTGSDAPPDHTKAVVPQPSSNSVPFSVVPSAAVRDDDEPQEEMNSGLSSPHQQSEVGPRAADDDDTKNLKYSHSEEDKTGAQPSSKRQSDADLDEKDIDQENFFDKGKYQEDHFIDSDEDSFGDGEEEFGTLYAQGHVPAPNLAARLVIRHSKINKVLCLSM